MPEMIQGECERVPDDETVPVPQNGNREADAAKESVCCLDPGCKATQSCMRPRCDYPGAGA